MTAEIIQTDGRAIVLDLSHGARLCGQRIADLDVTGLRQLIDATMTAAGTDFAFGRYAEPRELYTSNDFASTDDGEMRTIHMGVDLFCAAGTAVHAPLDAIVHCVANNDKELDYGPLIILRHESDSEHDVFSLYGHLGPEVLKQFVTGQKISAGEQIATVGAPPANGNWPPHLHFQIINDLLDLDADFPGVALQSQQEYWLRLSPSPAKFFPEIAAAALEFP